VFESAARAVKAAPQARWSNAAGNVSTKALLARRPGVMESAHGKVEEAAPQA
jgi:hypothetical protein